MVFGVDKSFNDLLRERRYDRYCDGVEEGSTVSVLEGWIPA